MVMEEIKFAVCVCVCLGASPLKLLKAFDWNFAQRRNNNNIIISKTMLMVLSSWQSHCESSPGSFDECRTAPIGRRPKTKPDDFGCESACTPYQNLHQPSPFILISQPESWYSFHRPTEGKRLSLPSWLVTYRDGLPVHRRSPILVLTGSDVAQTTLIEANALPLSQIAWTLRLTYWWRSPQGSHQGSRKRKRYLLVLSHSSDGVSCWRHVRMA